MNIQIRIVIFFSVVFLERGQEKDNVFRFSVRFLWSLNLGKKVY